MMHTASTPPSHENDRPDPEELLTRYGLRGSEAPLAAASAGSDTTQPSRKRRGRLRIYLAAAAGAGKTYAMLNEGHRRKGRGTDIVIGYVETHGRAVTEAQIGDLESIPRKHVTYHGVTLEEMDTGAILVRHPTVVLVDELAHTNVPGSKHPKRYQDVEELLDAGIHVVTTVNVQHLESLNDLIASITGVRVHETLPDRILDQADEVELVDISPHALRQRMQHGNIYPPERIEAALHNFFREGNLTALRELALRRTTEKTEEQLQDYMLHHGITKVWPTSERVLVGFDHQPHTREVIRDAWRLAHGLNADLIALSIEPEGYPALLGQLAGVLKYGLQVRQHQTQMQQHLEANAVFAEDLGAEVIRVRSRDVARAFVEVAREHKVTQMVLGQPAHRRWEQILRGSLVNRLLRLNGGITMHLVPHKRERED